MAERSNKRLAAVIFREFIHLFGAKDSNEGIIVATLNGQGKVQLAVQRLPHLSHSAFLVEAGAGFGGFAFFGRRMEVTVGGAGVAVATSGQDHQCQAYCQGEASGFGYAKALRAFRLSGHKVFTLEI